MLTQLEAAEKRYKKLTGDLEAMNRILENPDSTPDQVRTANKQLPKLEKEAATVFEAIADLKKKTGSA